MAAKKKPVSTVEYLKWKIESLYGVKQNDPYPALRLLVNSNRKDTWRVTSEYTIKVDKKKIEVRFYFSDYVELDELIADVQRFKEGVTEGSFHIDIDEEYDSYYSLVYLRGWRDMTKEELAEVAILRERYNAGQREQQERWRVAELEQAREVLRRAGEL